jgi:hypothetical protein
MHCEYRLESVEGPRVVMVLVAKLRCSWSMFCLSRCSSAATGFPVTLRDEDITTPFPRDLADIASVSARPYNPYTANDIDGLKGSVTTHDDVTVRDLYRRTFQHVHERP